MRVVTFKVEEELLKKLDLYAVNVRLSRSEVIREAIRVFLTQSVIQENHHNHITTKEL